MCIEMNLPVHVLGKQPVCSIVRRIEALEASGRPFVVLFDEDVFADDAFARSLFVALDVLDARPRYALGSLAGGEAR